MKILTKISFTLALAACLSAPALSVCATAATPTGYTRAEDVVYVRNGKYIYNWGVRDEACTFLSTYAEDFYEGEYAYSVLSEVEGGRGEEGAPTSELYAALQTLMTSKQTHTTSYDETRYQYCYTDCEGGGGAISCFYTQKAIGPDWDQGKTWNREHTWPNSKGDDSGKGEDDIMMLRPANSSTNSSRGNKAYGVGSKYYDPDKDLGEGESVRGDCARIMLYVYVRWGNIDLMWGEQGVIQSLPLLLDWMEQDPVDTWEMGRNDAVQAITGTRNVFVDYPEYAWLLFGEEMPTDMATPSGEAKKSPTTPTPPDDSSSVDAPDSSVVDSSTPELPDSSDSAAEGHEYGEWVVLSEPTETKDGRRYRECSVCGHVDMQTLPKTGADSSATGGLLNCSSVVISPVSITVILAGAYVFYRKKRS